ncbi:GIY-YIG nuclease family protein [Solitalea agri]|uniref:GIY-YIG nuclease family protein n=1 Tax=Solitalea TaxID=929509 RepID=UPI0036198BD1
MYFVYILYSKKLKRHYTGQTTNLNQRLDTHNSISENDNWTKAGAPWELTLTIECESLQQAIKIELHIKRMKSRTFIENLQKYPELILKLKEKYKSDC